MMKRFAKRVKMNATRGAHERTSICYEDICGRSHYQAHARLEGAVRRKRRPHACRCMNFKLSTCGSTVSILFWLSQGAEKTDFGMSVPSAGSNLQVGRVGLKHNAVVARAEQAESSDRMDTWCPIDGEGTLY
jgi:hypothetical protein